ncbi:MAG: hypothetical protein IJR09_06245 [Paludibacteraceae bacterium]|nr:hypothetical protein [Paludibacteraceae bacterium]MBQ6749017.1 hypothetical protein [Paludibacteraceae bacterium]MBR0064958.1 hypothetical protein [Paludibacteraceae bacterium]
MKKTVSLILFSCIAICVSAERIPYGSVVYLDVSQEWCCKATYAVCTSSGGDVARIMQPVEGKNGVYTYTVTMHDGMQENFRFGYSNQVVTHDQSGWSGFTTKDHDGNWSSAKPYYIITGSNGSGYWAAEPVSAGLTTLDSIDVSTPATCIDSTYDVIVSIWFTGMPCSIRISGDQWADDPVQTTNINNPMVIKKKGLKDIAGQNHQIDVTLYADRNYTSEIATVRKYYLSPEIECEVDIDLGDKCTNETVTLSTDAEGDAYIWSTGESGTSVVVTPSLGKQEITVDIYQSVLHPEQNLMSNGDFESNPPTGFTSDYRYVGWNPSSYYSSHGGESNLYAITTNANYFWKDFADIAPHGGSYYAIFDADQNGYAWKATTTDNPNLKIQKDSVYLFSYWVAYPNKASGNNPAVLQFEIKYQDKENVLQIQPLGNKYTLGKEEDLNGWYQQTVSWKAPCNSDYVEIAVKDVNNTTNYQGNDFCLDDIIFLKASSKDLCLSRREIFHINGINCDTVPPVEPECTDNWLRTKWTDMIFVDNSSGEFVRYQWYVNGEEIEGATEQYYRAYRDITLSTDLYYVKMWRADGTFVVSCEKTFGQINPSREEYPAPVQPQAVGRQVYLIGSHFRIVVTRYDDGSITAKKELY